MIRRLLWPEPTALPQAGELYRLVCTGLLGSTIIVCSALALGIR